MPHWTTPDGCRLYIQPTNFDPTRPTIVFLNGFAQTTIYWHPVANGLGKTVNPLCYDRRCQGRSDIGMDAPTLERHVADLAGLLEYLGVGRAHLVGLSLGGVVAAAMACSHPSRVDRLVICNTRARASATTDSLIRDWHTLLDTRGIRELARRLVIDGTSPGFRARHGAILDQIVDTVVARNSAAGLMRQLEVMLDDPPLETLLREVAAPMLIVASGGDVIAPAVESRRLAETIGAEFVRVDGVGHSLPAESPETFVTLIRNFLLHAPMEPPPSP